MEVRREQAKTKKPTQVGKREQMVGVEKVRHQILANLFCPIIRREFGFHQSRRAAGRGEERVRHGSVRPAVDVLHLLGPLPEPKAAAMPALLLHGAVHGGAWTAGVKFLHHCIHP